MVLLGRVSGVSPGEGRGSEPAAHRAIDGDTVLLAGGERLRLASVDCPETGRPGAEQARALLQTFLDRAGAAKLQLEPASAERDRYGRLLADLRVQGESVSRALVGAGLAWVYRSRDAELLEAQARAVRARRGIHTLLDHPASEGPYLLTSGSFHRPTCPVVRGRGASLSWAQQAAEPLAAGKAPCRTCLAWPPAAPFGAPGIGGQLGRERPPSGR